MLRETFFARLGGWGEGEGGLLRNNVSQILTIIDFSSRENAGKTLSVERNIIGNINLGQTSHLNLDKFGVDKDIFDCRSEAFA